MITANSIELHHFLNQLDIIFVAKELSDGLLLFTLLSWRWKFDILLFSFFDYF